MWRLLFLILFPVTISAQLKRFEFSQIKMGSPFNIIFYHTDSAQAGIIANECFALIDSFNNIFSDYSPLSEVGRVTIYTPLKAVKVSNELYEMIVLSKRAWKKSHKTFDITIGALTQLWRKAKTEKKFPSKEEIKLARANTGFKYLGYDLFTKTISFTKRGIRLDFGGIVPGYLAQKIIDLLKNKNINCALADASGDIVVSDPPPGKKGWTIAINLPESENEVWDKKLQLGNVAVSTSGDVYRYIMHDGKKYSHIIDPRNGYGITSQRNVTVITKNGAEADWLAKACSILPVKRSLRLAKKHKAEVLIAILKNEKIITFKTKNFDRFL